MKQRETGEADAAMSKSTGGVALDAVARKVASGDAVELQQIDAAAAAVQRWWQRIVVGGAAGGGGAGSVRDGWRAQRPAPPYTLPLVDATLGGRLFLRCSQERK